MKIALQSTEKTVTLQTPAGDVPARLWQGFTEDGVPVTAFITRLSPDIDEKDPRQDQFKAQLQEHAAPTERVQAIPLRLII